MKKFLSLVLAFILVFSSKEASADTGINIQSYADDRAGVLDEDVKDHIIKVNRSLEEKTGGQIVILTLDNLEGEEISTYANQVFNENQIGDRDQDNGVLVLLYVNLGKDPAHDSGNGEIFIEVGYGAEGFLNDAKVGRIIDDYMVDDLAEGSWSPAIRSGFDALTGEFLTEYGIDSLEGVDAQTVGGEAAPPIFGILFPIIILIFFLFLRISIIKNRGRGSRRSSTGNLFRALFWSNVFRGGDDDDDDNFFGGFGSGGGGGFSGGGFSGGGGSSGGGGAGRSF